MDFIFTLDPPLNKPGVNKRLGYRTPRSILLPPYLLQNAYWVDYANGIDAVFENMVDQPIDLLQNIRNMWVTNPELERKVMAQVPGEVEAGAALIGLEEWSRPERSLLIKQVNNLGMRLKDSSIVADESYLAIARFVGQYWFEKGTKSFIEFINFCLKTDLELSRLWTENYEDFIGEGSPAIGTPIWEGGTWYPTSHVSLVAKGGLENLDPDTLVAFFYEIANYNLVLESIEGAFDMYMVDDLHAGRNTAQIVAMAMLTDNNLVISNVMSYGVDAPPTYTMTGVPTKVYTPVIDGSNFTQQYLLAAPSSWLEDDDGDLIPIYAEAHQAVTQEEFIPSTLMGGASTTTPGDLNGHALIFGPVVFAQIPGSVSQARVPTFGSQPQLRTGNVNTMTTRMIGSLRSNILTNPKGFKPLNGDLTKLVPYW